MKTLSRRSFVLFGFFTVMLTAVGMTGGMSGCSGGGGGSDKTTLYIDADEDGYGSDASDAVTIKVNTKDAVATASGNIKVLMTGESGTISATQDGVVYVSVNTDCNDSDENINPAMEDTAGDGVDQNCDGADVDTVEADVSEDSTETIDSGDAAADSVADSTDADGDGVAAGTDCNDSDATVGGPTTYYADADTDTYGSASSTTTSCDSTAPSGYTTDNTDCDDSNADVNPGVKEGYFYANGGTDPDTTDDISHGDGIDNDCDGTVDETKCTCDDLTGYGSSSPKTRGGGLPFGSGSSLGTKVSTGSCDSYLNTFKSLIIGWDCVKK